MAVMGLGLSGCQVPCTIGKYYAEGYEQESQERHGALDFTLSALNFLFSCLATGKMKEWEFS